MGYHTATFRYFVDRWLLEPESLAESLNRSRLRARFLSSTRPLFTMSYTPTEFHTVSAAVQDNQDRGTCRFKQGGR